jgi:long-chain acyl-CoA synthetase
MEYSPRYKTLCDIFDDAVTQHGAREMLGTKVGGEWRFTTYAEFGALVDRLRAGLVSIAVGRGDRVAMVSNNRVEWAVAAFACYTLGAVFVPMYEAQSPSEWEFVVRECEVKVLFVANASALAKAKGFLDAMPWLRAVAVISGEPNGVSSELAGRVTTYAALLASGKEVPRVQPAPDDVAVIIYTSGTTGTPKGVVLSHRNLASNVSSVHTVFEFKSTERSLAFLPWAHVFGQTAELYLLMSYGASMAICEGPDKILENLAEVRPTLLFSVPRVFNKLYMAVEQQLAAKPKPLRRLVAAALAVAAKERAGRPVRFHERALRALVDKLVFEKVRARFGGRLTFTVSGSAALSQEVAEFIDSLGIMVYEGYGLTETSPVVSVNFPRARVIGSVGRPLPGVRVAIDPGAVQDRAPAASTSRIEGEIVVYGPNVMKGYYQRPEENQAVFAPDGGLRTGDMGYLDAGGYLFITGRIKEQYKLENGKYVVPSPLEEQLKLSPYIANTMIYGDNRPYNVALVVANVPALAKWAQAEHLHLPAETDALLSDARVRALFAREIARCSASFKSYEAIIDFALIGTDFTTDNGMLTPKQSLRRRRVLDAYGALFDQLYAKARDTSRRVAERPAS